MLPKALSGPLAQTSLFLQVAFCNAALARAREEQVRLLAQLREQRAQCRRLAHLATTSHGEPEKEALAPGSAGDSVSAESHGALQLAMEKLQVSLFQ